MEDAGNTEVSACAAPLFRSKKRKLYRQRAASPASDEVNTNPDTKVDTPVNVSSSLAVVHPNAKSDEDTEKSVAEALRLRKLRKHKVGGVGFRVTAPTAVSESQSLTTVPAEAQEQPGLEPSRRFVGQTGTVAEVDKHM